MQKTCQLLDGGGYVVRLLLVVSLSLRLIKPEQLFR